MILRTNRSQVFKLIKIVIERAPYLGPEYIQEQRLKLNVFKKKEGDECLYPNSLIPVYPFLS